MFVIAALQLTIFKKVFNMTQKVAILFYVSAILPTSRTIFQVGLVWQGGNGVDDLLREQMDLDIIKGKYVQNMQ